MSSTKKTFSELSKKKWKLFKVVLRLTGYDTPVTGGNGRTATSMVVTLHRRAYSLSVDLRPDEISATGGRRLFAPLKTTPIPAGLPPFIRQRCTDRQVFSSHSFLLRRHLPGCRSFSCKQKKAGSLRED